MTNGHIAYMLIAWGHLANSSDLPKVHIFQLNTRNHVTGQYIEIHKNEKKGFNDYISW